MAGFLPTRQFFKAGLFGIGTLVLASFATHAAYVQITRQNGPEGLSDPVAINSLNKRELAKNNLSPADIRKTKLLAQQSLRLQAINPAALALQGMAEASANRPKASMALLELSKRTSRRELLAHVAQIEDRARNDDAAGALRSYDHALNTSEEAADLLFPVLSNAIEDESIRRELAPYIKRQARWMPSFIYHTLTQHGRATYVSDTALLAGGFGRLDGQQHVVSNALIGALIDEGSFARARQHYLSVRPSGAGALGSISLAAGNWQNQAGRFGWLLNEKSDYGATQGQANVINAYAVPNVRGVAASKVLFLGPGQYDLNMAAASANEGPRSEIQLNLQCIKGKVYELAFDSANAVGRSLKNGKSWPVTITAGCDAHILQIIVAGGDGQQMSQATITALELRKLP
jgi:hypothetical protein